MKLALFLDRCHKVRRSQTDIILLTGKWKLTMFWTPDAVTLQYWCHVSCCS